MVRMPRAFIHGCLLSIVALLFLARVLPSRSNSGDPYMAACAATSNDCSAMPIGTESDGRNIPKLYSRNFDTVLHDIVISATNRACYLPRRNAPGATIKIRQLSFLTLPYRRSLLEQDHCSCPSPRKANSNVRLWPIADVR